MSITEQQIKPISASQLLAEHFRCSGDLADFSVSGDLSADSGYFRLGLDTICYGRCSSGVPAKMVTASLHDASEQVVASGSQVHLPFDPVEVVNNLRYEHYPGSPAEDAKALVAKNSVRNVYYLARPFLPVSIRKHLQRVYLRGWNKIPFPTWPVDRTVENIFDHLLLLAMESLEVKMVPFIWFWPDGAPSCTMLTHDVESSVGLAFCRPLMDLDDSFGVKASFQIVPEERYDIPTSLLDDIRGRGFELNVHDLNHDGDLMKDRKEFLRRAERINQHARRFGALGFRSAVLYRKTDWYGALDFSYDMSMPNVAHLDPQRGGCCTVLPFFVGKILELPLTTTQDYSLFHILNDYSIRLWKEQISLIRQNHGLISFIVHPDYIIPDRARQVYVDLLHHLRDLQSQGETWIALPRDVATWWRLRSQLILVEDGRGSWRIEGEGSERARVGYASIVGGKIKYDV